MQSESEGEDDIENDEFLKMAKYLQSMHNSLYRQRLEEENYVKSQDFSITINKSILTNSMTLCLEKFSTIIESNSYTKQLIEHCFKYIIK